MTNLSSKQPEAVPLSSFLPVYCLLHFLFATGTFPEGLQASRDRVALGHRRKKLGAKSYRRRTAMGLARQAPARCSGGGCAVV